MPTSKPPLPPLPIYALHDALQTLGGAASTQDQQHIKAIHRHLSHRLVLEGGLPSHWVAPRPPYVTKKGPNNTHHRLQYSAAAEDLAERKIYGGIKIKDLDVSVIADYVGPVIGISAKSTGNAFRNLTNRMEEALGECSNVHMMYPGFVFGFLHLIKQCPLGEYDKPNASFDATGRLPMSCLTRYHDVLVSLSGRTSTIDPAMRYEAVGLIVYQCRNGVTTICPDYPPPHSPVHYSSFFNRLYNIYDIRFAYPDSDGKTNYRKFWSVKGHEAPEEVDGQTGFPWAPRIEGIPEEATEEGLA
jgi:hypothetical protein